MNNPSPPKATAGGLVKALVTTLFAFLALAFLLGVFDPGMGKMSKGPQSRAMTQAHTLSVALSSYAAEHNGHYPDGQSSTEAFQKLIDGGYISDPVQFYLPFPGKIKPLPAQKLNPENVSFDFTLDVDATSSDQTPTVFMTGYKVSYVPGHAAVPINKTYTPLSRTWSQWWHHEIPERGLNPLDGIAVAYKSNAAKYLPSQWSSDAGYTVPNFLPPDFKSDGKVYRQLTPDGVLP